MDISKLVDYGNCVNVDIVRPDTFEPIGVSFQVSSFDADDVRAAANRVDSARYRAAFENEDKKLTDDQINEFSAASMTEQLCVAIKGWDWGGKEWGDLGVDPEFNAANLRAVITHPNAEWIRRQVISKAIDLGNFMNPSETTAPDTSA